MKRNLTIFMSCTGIILLLAGARWDLAISDALYAPDHLFAILLQDGWPLIMKLMLALCFALIADRRPAPISDGEVQRSSLPRKHHASFPGLLPA